MREGAAGEAGIDIHVDRDRDALDVSGHGGEVDGCAFDGVLAFDLLAQEASRALVGGWLVIKDEVLVAGHPTLTVGQEETEIRVGAGEGEGDEQPLPGFFGQYQVLSWHERSRGGAIRRRGGVRLRWSGLVLPLGKGADPVVILLGSVVSGRDVGAKVSVQASQGRIAGPGVVLGVVEKTL
jgi:hypothetical protein